MSVWPTVKKDLTGFTKMSDVDVATSKRFDDALEYNIPHGKKARGLLVLNTYQAMAKVYDEKDLEQACIMGWCVEMVSSVRMQCVSFNHLVYYQGTRYGTCSRRHHGLQ